MKVAIVGKYYTEGFGLHIEETLLDMGHKVVRVDPEVQFLQYDVLGQKIKNINKTLYQEVFGKIPMVRAQKAKTIYRLIEENNDIQLTIVLHDFLTPQEVKRIKEITKSPVVLWFPDALSNFKKAMFFVAGYDKLFFSDMYIVEKLKSEFMLNTHYLPQCFNPKKHFVENITKEDIQKYSCEITNAGNLYPSRAALYGHLLDYDFKMWGYPLAVWLKLPELKQIMMNEAVFNQEKAKAFLCAKVVLNNLHPAVIDGVNKRAFEIAGCGGFQIVSYRPEIEKLFEIDKEIVCYKDLSDLKAKLDYYIENEEARLLIAENGKKRAAKCHSYKIRISEMFDLI